MKKICGVFGLKTSGMGRHGGHAEPGSRRRVWRSACRVELFVALGVLLAGCSSTASRGVVPSRKKLTTVTMEIPTAAGIVYVPNYLGVEDGIYQKYGIRLKMELIPPPTAVDLVLSGKLDLMSATGSAQASSLKGRRIPTFEVESINQMFDLVGAPGIRSVKQLKGKVIVGESAVSAANTWEYIVLKHYGILPSEVRIVNVEGGNSARLDYVRAGKAAATVVDPTEAITANHEGLPTLSTGNFPQTDEAAGGFATTLAFADSHEKLMRDMVEATIAATKIVRDNEAKTVAVLERAPYSVPKADAAGVWRLMRPNWVTTGKPPKVAITNLLTVLESEYHLSKPPSESYLFDWAFIPHG